MTDDPEVTIEPADNGYIVRHYARSLKKDEPGRTIRRVASTSEEALRHAGTVLGAKKTSRKKENSRDGHENVGEISPAPTAHSHGHARGHVRRRRPRVGGRR